MNSVARFLRDALRTQHSRIDQVVQELTAEQLHRAPPGSAANHIAFTLWHIVRTEDNVVQFILQDRKPTVWIEGGYFERFGLDRIAQGTGMTTEDAHALRLPPLDQWLEYQQAVWQATDGYLSAMDDSALARTVTIRPLPEMTASQALANVVLIHDAAHFGEICVLRVLQGLPSGII